MTELSPDNYKKVIKKANTIRNNNIKEKLRKNEEISGFQWFKKRIEKTIKYCVLSPEATCRFNRERLNKFLKGKKDDGIS